jgi:hypothetical protein
VEFLSIWVGNMNMNMNMNDRLDPDVIIVGGGVSGMLTPFFADIGKRLRGGASIPELSKSHWRKHPRRRPWNCWRCCPVRRRVR